MKKTFFLLAATLLVVSTIQAQKISGIATYESKMSIEDKISTKEGSNGATEEIMDMVKEMMKSLSEKTFTLTFNENVSLYEEDDNILPGDNAFGESIKMISALTYGIYYKNPKEGYYAQAKEIFDKEFTVKDSLEVFNWELGTETKQIGNYTCFKATATKTNDLSGFEKFKDEQEKEEENSTNFLSMIDIPKETKITAWYTPEIPISQGPFNYWGLPGLIMEVSDGTTTILCSKIVLNPKKKIQIKEPKKGKIVTEKEFQKITMEQVRDLQKASKTTTRRTRGGGTIQVETRTE